METPQSMFEDPSRGSNTTMYLQNEKELVTWIYSVIKMES